MTTTEATACTPIRYQLTDLGLRELAAYTHTLTARMNAVLAIHSPCHDDQSEPYDCLFGHGPILWDYDEPRTAPECVHCSYDDRRFPYPCPTALAAGAQPEGAPHR